MIDMEMEMMKERKKFSDDLFCSRESRNMIPKDPVNITAAIK